MKHRSHSGFTLLEVVIASTVMALIFLSLVDALFFVRRTTRAISLRLAAEEIAYDTVSEIFNRSTTWYESYATASLSEWKDSTYNATTYFSEKNSAFENVAAQQWIVISPSGNPITYWKISTNVRWQDPFTQQWNTLSYPVWACRYNILRNTWR